MWRATTLASLVALAAALGAGCGGSIGGGDGDGSPGTPIPVRWQYGALIALESVPTLPAHTAVPHDGYPNKAMRLGAFVDDSAWQAFATLAQIAGAPAIAAGQSILFAVLDAQTNALAPLSVERRGAALTYTIEWEGIEPYYPASTPAALVLVDTTGIATVSVRATTGGATAGAVGSFTMP